MTHSPLRVALADDQALVRHGLRALLTDLGGIDVVIDAEDGESLLKALQCTRVDLVIADVRMPKFSGVEVTQMLREHGDFTPVILLTTFDEPKALTRAAKAGAQAFLLKDIEPEELRAAIDKVMNRESLFALGSLQRVPQGAAHEDESVRNLTEREIAVLRLVASGYSNKEIGQALSISGGTVKNHMTEIMEKLNARDRTHAVLKAIANRFL
jgi:DNA-binding NarL/FixJ family response regulator